MGADEEVLERREEKVTRAALLFRGSEERDRNISCLGKPLTRQ
jgi:hypothetical protein